MKTTYYGITHLNNGIYKAGMYRNKFVKRRYYHSILRLIFGRRLNIDNTVPIGFSNYSHGYFHWLFESLPFYFKYQSKSPIYLPSNHNTFHPQLLALLGMDVKFFNRNEYLNGGGETLQLRNYKDFEWSGIIEMRNKVWETFKTKTLVNKKKVFIVREASMRNIINQKEVIDFFTSKGWCVFNPSEYSVEAQIRMFVHSTVICSIHGAGLANIVWCEPNTRVVEIAHQHMDNSVYEIICNNLDLNHEYIFGDTIGTHPDSIDRSDLFISINLLASLECL